MVLRFSSQKESTLGLFFDVTNGRKFLCFTLEDEFRTVKVYGKTRIPAGKYKVGLRKEGGFHNKYSKKFPSFHIGMLQILDVPDFEYVLIHIGNDDDDTAACLLTGDQATQNITKDGFVGNSTGAYKRIYPKIANAIEAGEEVEIEYIDFA